MALKDYSSKTKRTKEESTARDKVVGSFFGGKDIFSTFIRSKFSKTEDKKSVKEKSSSPTKEGESASISQDSLVFLKIIAQNSISLPGMARDVNVLRQNVVKLVKLKAKTTSTKADSFFKTEDQRESELEATRRKQEAKVSLVEKGGKPKTAGKEKEAESGGMLSAIWSAVKKLGSLIFFGLMAAIGSAIVIGDDIVTFFKEKFKPMELIESFFNSIKEGWTKITETDIVKETLIKGIGGFLDFVTGGLFGEKELRTNLDKLSEELKPVITFFTEMFDKVANWMAENIGWDKFTIPLSKYSFTLPLSKYTSLLPESLQLKDQKVGLPDITVPGFRPFSQRTRVAPPPPAASSPSASTTSPTPASTTPEEDANELQRLKNRSPQQEDRKQVDGDIKTKSDALNLLEKFGVKQDSQSPSGFSDVNGKPIEEPILRSELTRQGVDAERIINLVKTSPTPEAKDTIAKNLNVTIPGQTPTSSGGTLNSSSLPSADSLGGANQQSSPSQSSPSSPSADTMQPKTSGSSLGQLSSDVAEGQRMDSAPDIGNVVNTSTVNNNKGTLGGGDSKIADAYNSSFIDSYFKTA
jgi:hypothetical protein